METVDYEAQRIALKVTMPQFLPSMSQIKQFDSLSLSLTIELWRDKVKEFLIERLF